MSTTVVHRRPPVRCCIKCCQREAPSQRVYEVAPAGSIPTKPYHWPRKDSRWTSGTSFYYRGWRYYSTNSTTARVASRGYARYDLMCETVAAQPDAMSAILYNELLPAYPVSCGNDRDFYVRVQITSISQPTVVSFHVSGPKVNTSAPSMFSRAFAAITGRLGFRKNNRLRASSCIGSGNGNHSLSTIDKAARRMAVQHGVVPYLNVVRGILHDAVTAELTDNLGCHRWHCYKDVLTNWTLTESTRNLLPVILRANFRPCACRHPSEDAESWPYECVREALDHEMRCQACKTYRIGTELPCQHRICCKCALQYSSWWQTNDQCFGACPFPRCRRVFTAVRRLDLAVRDTLESNLARRTWSQ